MFLDETIRSTKDGRIEILAIPSRRYRITLRPFNANSSVEKQSCESSFPLELIDYFADKCPFSSLCAWIARYEDPEFKRIIRQQLFAYFRPSDFEQKRLLDFGCGFGASTFAIASVLPNTEIVGIDLDPNRIDIARKIAETQEITNIRFLVSPSGDSLPPGLGIFDFVTLNAVYEHLLPEERKALMPLLWSVMKPDSVLFVNQTPYRYFPYEHHSTGLWLINYFPDSVAHFFARKFSHVNPGINRLSNWNVLLRNGIRGATEREIIRNLCAGGGKATILQPTKEGMTDRASYWLACTGPDRFRTIKRAIAVLFRYSDRLFGTVPSLNIDVAIRKDR